MEDVIQLKKDNILRFAIVTSDGKDTGEYLEFDLEDIELPLKINQCEAMHRKNIEYVNNQFTLIDKKEDKQGKFLLSFKEEEKIKVMRDFYKKEMEALDLFLGEGGTKKLLNGRRPYYSMYNDINEMLEPILPKINAGFKTIKEKIEQKYKKDDIEVLQ